MSRAEARRRLQEADPNLTIIHGRRLPYAKHKLRVPKLLSSEEAGWLGLEEMEPIIPTQVILHIEGKWSKRDLQSLCNRHNLDSRGDKELLVSRLLWAGVIDEQGNLVKEVAKT